MTARAPRIRTVGTAAKERGGAGGLVAVLRDGGPFERAAVPHASTHRGCSFLATLASVNGFRRAIACLWRRPAIVRAHAASHARCARTALLLWLARCAGCQAIFQLHGGGLRQFGKARPDIPARRRIRHTRGRSWLVIALTEGWAGFARNAAPHARIRVAGHYSTETVCSRPAAIHNDLARA